MGDAQPSRGEEMWVHGSRPRQVAAAGIPLVYDAHHHRCHPDAMSVDEATDAAAATWGDREPWTHISSPRDGWAAPNPRPHADYIDPADVPRGWLRRRMTMDVEAKEKDRAVVRLITALKRRKRSA